MVCILNERIHIRRFSLDWQIVRETPRRPTRLWSRKRRTIDRHLVFGEFPNSCPRKHPFHEHVLIENHLLTHTRRSEFLEVFDGIRVKIIPGRHGTDELHECQATDELWPARCQVK